ncbi:squalene synthase 2-like isoform X2 [Tasmannia lanceolata]|uniref:squalene synthase 2-like isoform X2 n=1 Tax=Tasmannia lanceolata TaxID=3420 RepID=UPI0040641ED7
MAILQLSVLYWFGNLLVWSFASGIDMCYNNVKVFRGVVKMRHGLTAKVIDQTRTMSDVYGAFFDFSCMLKSKIDKNDPNALKTVNQIETIQKACRNSGLLHRRRSYLAENKPTYNSVLIIALFILLSILFAYLSIK